MYKNVDTLVTSKYGKIISGYIIYSQVTKKKDIQQITSTILYPKFLNKQF